LFLAGEETRDFLIPAGQWRSVAASMVVIPDWKPSQEQKCMHHTNAPEQSLVTPHWQWY
jgi:hypothetical protein